MIGSDVAHVGICQCVDDLRSETVCGTGFPACSPVSRYIENSDGECQRMLHATTGRQATMLLLVVG